MITKVHLFFLTSVHPNRIKLNRRFRWEYKRSSLRISRNPPLTNLCMGLDYKVTIEFGLGGQLTTNCTVTLTNSMANFIENRRRMSKHSFSQLTEAARQNFTTRIFSFFIKRNQSSRQHPSQTKHGAISPGILQPRSLHRTTNRINGHTFNNHMDRRNQLKRIKVSQANISSQTTKLRIFRHNLTSARGHNSISIRNRRPFFIKSIFRIFINRLRYNIISRGISITRTFSNFISSNLALNFLHRITQRRRTLTPNLFSPTYNFFNIFILIRMKGRRVNALANRNGHRHATGTTIATDSRNSFTFRATEALMTLLTTVQMQVRLLLQTKRDLHLFNRKQF